MGAIEEKSFAFAVEIVKTVKDMRTKHQEYDLTRQLMRSGTSIGANVSEAKGAQSTRDFIAKLSIASKEAQETRYWIRLLRATGYLEESDGSDLLRKAEELVRMLTSSVKTLQKKETQDSKLKTQNSHQREALE